MEKIDVPPKEGTYLITVAFQICKELRLEVIYVLLRLVRGAGFKISFIAVGHAVQ